jgi:hypothetical protein
MVTVVVVVVMSIVVAAVPPPVSVRIPRKQREDESPVEMRVMIIIPIRHEALPGDDDFIDYHWMHVRRTHAPEVVALRHIVDADFAEVPDRHGIRNTMTTQLDDVLRKDNAIVLEF